MRAKKYISLLMLFLSTQLTAAESKHSPYLEKGTFLIVEVSVDEVIERVDEGVDDILAFCRKHDLGIEEEIDDVTLGQIRGMLKIAQGFGIETATAYLSIEDIKIDYGPVVVLSVKEGTSAKATQLMLQGLLMNDSSVPFKAEIGSDGSTILVGMPKAIAQYQKLEPTDRTDLLDALESTEGIVRFALSSGEDARRVIRELWPSLPRPFETLSGELLADRMQHVAGDLIWKETPNLSVRLEMTDDRSAELADELMQIGLSQAVTMLAKEDPSAAELINLLQEFPRVKSEGSTVELNLDFDTKGQEILTQQILVAVQSARESALRSVRMNHMKQILLAMHYFHDKYEQFPAPAAICDAEGEPLLSWRVALLPYLEQVDLYNKFHLDEPWDSPHNLDLVKQMPALFAIDGQPELTEMGKTVILRPIYDGHDRRRESKRDEVQTPIQKDKEGKAYYFTPWLQFADYTDGSSHTVLVVEADAKSAVTWTKPDDWNVDLDNPKEGIFEKSDGQGEPIIKILGFADGHAGPVKDSVDVETLRRAITHNGAKPYSW